MEKKIYNTPEMNVMKLEAAQTLLAGSGGEVGSGSGPDSTPGTGAGSARPHYSLFGEDE